MTPGNVSYLWQILLLISFDLLFLSLFCTIFNLLEILAPIKINSQKGERNPTPAVIIFHSFFKKIEVCNQRWSRDR